MRKKADPTFPDRKRLDEVRRRLSDPSVLGSSLLPDNASPIDRAKFKACEAIIKFRRKNGLKQKELAASLGIDESRMSEILHYKIEGFTLDRLVGYAQVLYPNLKLELTAA
jgi:predicted XRE-type DNA-binding protein